MGLCFLVIGITLFILSFFIPEMKYISLASTGFGLLGGGFFMLLIYAFENKKQYLTLKDEVLIKNNLIPLKVKLSEIKSIREFAGDMKLKTEKFEFVIDTQIIEPASLAFLKNELMKLDLSIQ